MSAVLDVTTRRPATRQFLSARLPSQEAAVSAVESPIQPRRRPYRSTAPPTSFLARGDQNEMHRRYLAGRSAGVTPSALRSRSRLRPPQACTILFVPHLTCDESIC